MLNKKKILIIEDQLDLLKNYEMMLADDYSLDQAQDGEEGLKKAKEKPDLILLDVSLPGMDGIEVLQRLKEDEETDSIPVIVLTNLSDEITVGNILKAGGKDYMVKSDWSLDDIKKRIEKLI